MEHDLSVFLKQVHTSMGLDYERIQNYTLHDPGTAGDEGEENWANFLRDWLPSHYSVQTKGNLISSDGRRSPQADIVVLKPGYPIALQKHKTWLADGVAAVFECKNTLTAKDVRTAFEQSAKFKRLVAPYSHTSPFRDLHSPLTFGLLAHSHSWNRPKSEPRRNIENAMHNAANCIYSPKMVPDILCVSDLALWSNLRSATVDDTDPNNPTLEVATNLFRSCEETVPPISSLVTLLFARLSYDDPDARVLSKYLVNSKNIRMEPIQVKRWDETSLTAGTANSILRDDRPSDAELNEWVGFLGYPTLPWRP